jgi:hypothetical protein
MENVAQLFAIEPCTRGARGGDLRDQHVELGGLFVGQLASVLEQRPAQTFERRICLLLQAPHLAHGIAGVSEMELVEGDPGVGEIFGDTFDEGRRHVDADRFDVFGSGLVSTQIFGKGSDGGGILAFGEEHDPAGVRIDGQGRIVVAAFLGGLVERHRVELGQVSALGCQLDIAGANGMHPMPGFAHSARDRRKRHLLGEHQHQRLEQQGEP